MWVVEVFTLSRRIWETVYMDAPFKSCDLVWIQVSIDGVIYWRAYDNKDFDDGLRSNFIIWFDLKSDTFGEVCLPERLVYTHYLLQANINESLVLLEYNDEPSVCDVWMRNDGENKAFTKIFTVKPEGRSVYHIVLGFRKNGEVVLEMLPLTALESLSLLTRSSTLDGSVNGLLSYHGYYNDTREKLTKMAAIWNLAIRKSVGIVIPKALYMLQVVSIDGVIYWRAYYDKDLDDGLRSNFIIWFDLKSDTFGEMRNDGENKPFTKIYTVKPKGRSVYHIVLGFRKNGEVVLEVRGFFSEETEIDVYEPSSGRINSVGIVGKYANAKSYMETLLLLDEPNTIIHS
nr:hypothetical protein [Tanacetum cinerariifolium]